MSLQRNVDIAPGGLRHYLPRLLACFLLAIAIGSLIVLATGENPLQVYGLLFREAFFQPRGLMIAIQRATPLIFTSAAATMAFQAGAVNTGLPGQFLVGAAVAAIAAYLLPSMPAALHVTVILFLCMLGGAAAAFIPAFFTRISGITEIVTCIISNYIIQYLVAFLLGSSGLRAAAQGRAMLGFPDSARLVQFIELTDGQIGTGSKANVGIFVGIVVVALVHYWMRHSAIGYEIRMSRLNRNFAQFAGMSAGRGFFLGMMLSGSIAALGGAAEILGVWREYRLGTMAVGDNSLIISLIGGQHFIGTLLAALAYGQLEAGAMSVSWITSVSRPLVDILVVLILIFAALPSMRSFATSGDPAQEENWGWRLLNRR